MENGRQMDVKLAVKHAIRRFPEHYNLLNPFANIIQNIFNQSAGFENHSFEETFFCGAFCCMQNVHFTIFAIDLSELITGQTLLGARCLFVI